MERIHERCITLVLLVLVACGRTQLVPPDAGDLAVDGGAGGGAPECTAPRAICPVTRSVLGGQVQEVAQDLIGAGTQARTDSTGRVVIAYHLETPTGRSRAQLIRSVDGGYEALGVLQDSGLQPALALVHDVPHLAWVAESGRSPRVARWTCAGWEELGAVSLMTRGFAPSLAASPAGALYLAAGDQSDATVVFAWREGQWTRLGEALRGRFDASLAADDAGPLVAVSNGASIGSFIEVLRWDGSAWTPLGRFPGSVESASRPSIAIDPRGRVVVAWLDSAATHWQVRCARWDGAWTVLAPPQQPTPGTASSRPSIAFGPDGEPRLAWRQFLNPDNADVTSAAWVTRWTGSAWIEVLPRLFVNSTETVAEPSLTFDRHGEPVVVWDEFDGLGYRVELWTREGCL